MEILWKQYKDWNSIFRDLAGIKNHEISITLPNFLHNVESRSTAPEEVYLFRSIGDGVGHER